MNKVLWLTGRSGAGKTTLANALKDYLEKERFLKVIVLDGDEMRKGLNRDLGFAEEDRLENGRRISHVANLFSKEGYLVICAVLSPFERMRREAKVITGDKFVEVYINASKEECNKRDPKGLYAAAGRRSNVHIESMNFYEIPVSPDIEINTEMNDIDTCVASLISQACIHLGFTEGSGI